MTMAEDKLKEIVNANDASIWKKGTKNNKNCHEQFRIWFLQQFAHSTTSTTKRNECSLDDFALYFLNAVRQQTEIHLRTQDSETPKCLTPIRTIKSSAVIAGSDDTTTILTPKRLLLEEKNATSTKTPFESTSEFEESIFKSYNTNQSSSTPLRNTRDRSPSQSYSQSDTSTPVGRRLGSHTHSNQKRSGQNFQTPNSQDRQTRSSSASSSICLGDFIVLNTSSRLNKKKASQLQQYVGSADTPITRKSKKRVVPTTISNGSPNESGGSAGFGSVNSSFSNENNFLKFANQEIDDKAKCSIMEARKSLKFNATEISKELEKSSVSSKPCVPQSLSDTNFRTMQESNNTPAAISEILDTLVPIDLGEVTNRNILQRLANIYSILIDLNFATNVLNEIAFLLNLLNASPEQQNQQHTIAGKIDSMQTNQPMPDTANPEGIDALHNFSNCIFFAMRVLELQRHVLVLLDAKSLSVILNNERICYLDDDFKLNLDSIYQRKLQIDVQKSLHNNTSIRFDKSFKNVYYQEDKDSRQNFTSNNEFGAFKSQRDLFYKTLKLWEVNHLNPTWSFSAEITPKIRDIFRQSENPVNMAHFAKLFVSQLLISSSDTTSPEEIGLEVDLQKFSRLTQRLVAPSNFSVDYQFPRNQAFFRDFIEEARSIPFAEQLKISLYAELITLNDSTFEQLNICKKGVRDDDDEDEAASQNESKEFVVRPEVLSSMIILAKFLGYVTAQPFQQQQSCGSSISIPGKVEKKQIMLRSFFQPHFNVCRLLQQAINNGKLLITLPWLVQYLAMLDNVTLQLDTFVEATQVMFALYMNLGKETLQLLPTSVFIIRCCLGWLFETKQIIAEQYYNHRACQHMNSDTEEIAAGMQELCILIPSDVAKELSSGADADALSLCLSNFKRDENGSYACILQQQRASHKLSTKGATAATSSLQLNPILESYLNVACPFLAEFRVSIMPAKYAMTKYVSRTGRYRHITTRIAELSPSRDATSNSGSENENLPQISMKRDQTKLIEAFLHSQNSSMRRLIEFIIERIYKSVVKDAQYKILLPSKAAADAKINDITSCNHREVAKVVSAIYAKARTDAFQQWDIAVAKSMDERIEKGLNALLPAETAPAIKKTYFYLIRRNAAQKVQQWRYANMLKNNFYCQDLNEMAQKICKANSKLQKEPQTLQSSELKIVRAEPSVSDLIDGLQYWLHCTSMRPDLVSTIDPIIEYLQRLPPAFENTLPTVFYRLIGAGIVQLLQHIIVRHPFFITKDILDAACNVWLQQKMQCVTANANLKKKKASNESGGSDDNSYDKDATESDSNSKVSSIFDSLITISFIESLDVCRHSYQKLTELLVEMVKQRVIRIDYVNGLFMAIFKKDWAPDKLNEMSNMLQEIAKETGSIKGSNINAYNDEEDNYDVDDGKSHLFMEVLADFSRDIDRF